MATVVSAANRHDMKLFGPVLDGLVVVRPRPSAAHPQHLCADKGYDYPALWRRAHQRRYVPHIKERGLGEERCRHGRRHPARRWVVERTNGWHNRFRGLLVRYERKGENYLGMVELANAIICYRRALA